MEPAVHLTPIDPRTGRPCAWLAAGATGGVVPR